jgi:DNA-binding FrmR family transcriptional regulator
MIDDGRDCLEIIDQLASVKAAVNGLSVEMVETFALYCLRNPDQFASEVGAIEQAVKALVRAGR